MFKYKKISCSDAVVAYAVHNNLFDIKLRQIFINTKM